MARISGVDLPNSKRVEIGLTYIYGIGRYSSIEILKKTKIDANTRISDLTDDQVSQIRSVIEADYQVEGDLRREINLNIKRLMDLGNYRGLRHRRTCLFEDNAPKPMPELVKVLGVWRLHVKNNSASKRN